MDNTIIILEFEKLRLNNAMTLQSRMMELTEALRHDRKIESNEEEEEDDDDDDWDDEEENDPVQTELYMLMEIYKTITKVIL